MWETETTTSGAPLNFARSNACCCAFARRGRSVGCEQDRSVAIHRILLPKAMPTVSASLCGGASGRPPRRPAGIPRRAEGRRRCGRRLRYGGWLWDVRDDRLGDRRIRSRRRRARARRRARENPPFEDRRGARRPRCSAAGTAVRRSAPTSRRYGRRSRSRSRSFRRPVSLPSSRSDPAVTTSRRSSRERRTTWTPSSSSSGRTATAVVAAALMGSVARALCHHANQPVLVVPPHRAVAAG